MLSRSKKAEKAATLVVSLAGIVSGAGAGYLILIYGLGYLIA